MASLLRAAKIIIITRLKIGKASGEEIVKETSVARLFVYQNNHFVNKENRLHSYLLATN